MAESMPVRQHSQPIYVVSGGAGASGELLLRTVLAQFPDVDVPVAIWPYVHEPEQVDDLIAQAVEEHATVVHTLVRAEMRHFLVREAAAYHVPALDLIGGLMDHLSHELRESPLGQPGRYRTLHNSYFRRVEAIEYAVNHDDGKRVEDLPKAEIVLLGVSRVGKTPVSIYLSIQGWKVANVPLAPAIPLPQELAQVDPQCVVGLTIEPLELLRHRRVRQEHMGLGEGAYTARDRVIEEVRAATHLYYDRGYAVVDVTDKPIETISEEILAAVTRGQSHGHEATL